MYVTAHADPDTLRRARITEPFGYITKPFQSVDLSIQIEAALCAAMEQNAKFCVPLC